MCFTNYFSALRVNNESTNLTSDGKQGTPTQNVKNRFHKGCVAGTVLIIIEGHFQGQHVNGKVK